MVIENLKNLILDNLKEKMPGIDILVGCPRRYDMYDSFINESIPALILDTSLRKNVNNIDEAISEFNKDNDHLIKNGLFNNNIVGTISYFLKVLNSQNTADYSLKEKKKLWEVIHQ